MSCSAAKGYPPGHQLGVCKRQLAYTQRALLTKGHLLVGGNFKIINNSRADPYYTSLNPLITDSSGTKGRYRMSRANADDMLVTPAGLWIASSDRFNASMCANATGHTGICFLP